MHHWAQLRSKDKGNMSALDGILEESSKSRRKSAAHMIHRNTMLSTLASENKLRIATHLIRSNTVLAILASENNVRTNLF